MADEKEPVQTAPVAEKPQDKLAASYDLGDTSVDPEIDLAPEPQPASAPPAEPVVAATPEPKASAHSPRLVQMALDLGIPQAEIDSTPTENLDYVVYHLNRVALEAGKAKDRQAAAPAPAPEEEIDLGINEADYDPNLIAALKKVAKGNSAKVRELEAKLAAVAGNEQVRQQESLADQIDNAFVGLGDNFKSIFGAGRRNDVSRDSDEYSRRMAVLNKMDSMKTGTFKEKFDKSVRSLFGVATPQAGAKKPAPSLEEWQKAGLARPTQRTGSAEPKGEKKAIRTAAEFMKEKGMLNDDDMPNDSFLK